ncbi:hypothetical protein E5S70_26945 [Ensifer adhaerens]|uniref:hypothetical protein n=1 Tax=Ensifer canadensis TaxID=555315 RepID=UPI001490770A|nr:hypothetical protein [Ensifer canadensis]NOV19668.1 hypothetical protein [Ensifer canadensis]
MSMELNLVRTRFETLSEEGDVEFVSYGFRLYDDLDCTYGNTIDSLDKLLAMSVDELVDFARSSSPTASAMLNSVGDADGVRFYVDGDIYSDR